ncbi:acyltransferase [Mucilaginibacter sp. R11]|uniref:Acyltransferase n=1 Tax=Mucilaginibacter agri TaxID=2695265 RepID=A0A965ZDL5_9SPHI|nr:DapH/DapD/GlmU-related protein [Mucilaginibacter agri]NCD67817.1 acyltransferase [Mucilaginibacter agri]
MASFKFLFKNRARHNIGSKKFYIAWLKRFFSFPEAFKRNFRRWTLIRKGAVIDETAEIGVITLGRNAKGLFIGGNSFIGRVEVALHDEVRIGNNVCINDGCKILTGSHDITDALWRHVKSPIVIEDYAWIATNAIILPGVRVGTGAVVGAGAVVSKNVAPYEIVVGNPARPIQRKRTESLNYNPCSFLAANLAWLKG